MELTQEVLGVAYCSLLVLCLYLYFCPTQKHDNKYGRYYPYSYRKYKSPKRFNLNAQEILIVDKGHDFRRPSHAEGGRGVG